VAEPVTFGARIKALRISAKLSQREFADRVAKRLRADDHRGFDFTYLSKIENDKLTPSAAVVIAMAEILVADSDELLALVGKTPSDMGSMIQSSPGARMFFRSAFTKGLSEDQWKELIKSLEAKKK
jgi:transcriptional regulator with XRE-family HTH domain